MVGLGCLAIVVVVLLVIPALLLGRLRRSPVPISPTGLLQALDLSAASGGCDVHVVGESHYQSELRRVARSGRTFLTVLLPEPTNPKDPNAIRVVAENGGTVGYLSRTDAEDYREVFAILAKHGRGGACRAKLIGGIGHKRYFGVMLNLRDPQSLLVDIRDTLEPGTVVSETVQPF